MPVVGTHDLVLGQPIPYVHQIYNGTDCLITEEILRELKRTHNEEPVIYGFERALQAPALEMMLRGWKVDQYARAEGIATLRRTQARLYSQLGRLGFAATGRQINPRSRDQLMALFYETMCLPQQWSNKKGVRKLSMDREALEALSVYFYAKPFVNLILAIRENAKSIEVLETQIDPDGRMRTSINIAGTETGRWSSSASSFGTGGNMQNLDPELRYIFDADPGWKLCAIDLEQAESREVGWLSGTICGDWSYYDACLGGDLHTITARLVWPKLPWSGDIKADKALAEQPFYRHFSYRDMSKRGSHGSNYYGTPATMAKHLKVRKSIMEDFQQSYFGAFPGIPAWHRYTAQELQQHQELTTIFGRRRHFFGRPNDDTTLREAIAYCPQSATADRMNLIIWRLWKHMGTRIRLLLQVHDAVYFLMREDDNEADVIQTALSYFDIPIAHSSGRSLVVPGEAKIGWNWGQFVDPAMNAARVEKGHSPLRLNPNGLVKYKGPGLDKRTRVTVLDRRM